MISFSVTSLLLLLGHVIAAPMPVPPPIGKVVFAAPGNTDGGVKLSEPHKPHPHIVVGHGSNGVLHLAPVSHTYDEAFKPHMSSSGMHRHLDGNVHLGHVTALENKVTNPTGSLAQGLVSAKRVKAINRAKQAEHTAAHQGAARAHMLAADAHRQAEHAHTTAATSHAQHAQAHHQAETAHQKSKEEHKKAANKHRDQALEGPKSGSLVDAHASAKAAGESRKQAGESRKQADSATGWHMAGGGSRRRH